MKIKEFLGDITNDNIKDKINETAGILILLIDLKKFLDNYENESETDSETESISDIDFIKTDDIELLSDSDDD